MSRPPLQNDDSSSENGDWVRPIVKENLSERAYLDLRGALMRGQLRPGERLRLRPMSARFGISATPMREALLRLVSEKALTLDQRGTVVVPSLTLTQLLEIRSIRMDLEGRAAGQAALMASEEEIEGLQVIQDQIALCHRDRDFVRAIDLNTEFHLLLCNLGQLPIVYDIVESLWVRCGPIISHLYDTGLPDWDPHPHVLVIDALRRRNPQEASAAIARDIEHGGKGLIIHAQQAGGEA